VNPLATTDDYALLIGPVSADEEVRLEYLLLVASSVVATVAPGLVPWTSYDVTDPDAVDPGPVPPPATLVTCQSAARLMANPTGSDGAVTQERVGMVETSYNTDWSVANAILPSGWRLMLKPWRPPDLAAIKLSVPHPAEYLFGSGYGGDWWWLWSEGFLQEEEPAP
jgi:hypothetical protein